MVSMNLGRLDETAVNFLRIRTYNLHQKCSKVSRNKSPSVSLPFPKSCVVIPESVFLPTLDSFES